MSTSHSFDCTVGGRQFTLETGKLAEQAGGAVIVRYGDTVLLATAVVSKQAREGVDFLPLTIDYEERLYAAGKIPGGFLRREGRPTEAATLVCRLTDRPIRPLLPKHWRREIQIIITTLSIDQENDPDTMAVIGASAALSISEMPFDGPISAVHVGYINNELVVNPTMPQMSESTLDVVVASTKEAVIMLEAGASEISEDIVAQAIQKGHEANQEIIKLQEKLVEAAGKTKEEIPPIVAIPELEKAIADIVGDKLAEAISQPDKVQRKQRLDQIKEELTTKLGETYETADTLNIFDGFVRKAFRSIMLDKGIRPSGRGLKEIRPLSAEVSLLPRVHGSSLFARGETQVLNIATLGPMNKKQPMDGLGLEESKRYIHHYNFTPFSTGEVKRSGSTGRREIGHGVLAERALRPMIPSEEDFPYTIRLVSEVLSSSGSTSMASTCSSSMTLMDAGVPIKRAVAGISIGLVTGENGKFTTLTDIEGIEDAYGDMDFKVAGTTEGITAIQLDMKIKGINQDMVIQTLKQAKEARGVILEVMNKAISQSRTDLSPYAPRMYKVSIDPEKIGAVIGAGGKTIRAIQEETGTTLDVNSDGTIFVGATNQESAGKATKMIENLTKEVEIGEIYDGKVVRLMGFGAFVEILPGKDGMVHISELADRRVEKVEDVVKVGDTVKVKVIDIDSQGRVNLSIRALLGGQQERRPERPQFSRPPRQDNRNRR